MSLCFSWPSCAEILHLLQTSTPPINHQISKLWLERKKIPLTSYKIHGLGRYLSCFKIWWLISDVEVMKKCKISAHYL